MAVGGRAREYERKGIGGGAGMGAGRNRGEVYERERINIGASMGPVFKAGRGREEQGQGNMKRKGTKI